MMAGAIAHCYGAHGIWNVGDGEFLGHWGQQTFEQARALDTPRLLGQSHHLFMTHRLGELKHIKIDASENKLISIRRHDDEGHQAIFYPEVGQIDNLESGQYFLPLTGEFVNSPPTAGMVIVLTSV
jgi:hypothetical protein